MNEENLVNLRHWMNVVSRGRWIIAGCAVGVMLLAVVFTFTRTPVFEASSRLYLTPQKVRTLTFDDLFANDGGRLNDRLLTQMEIIRSWVTLQKAVDDLETRGIVNFEESPAPDDGFVRRSKEFIKDLINYQSDTPPPTPERRKVKFIAKLAKSLNVQTAGGKAFLAITVRHRDPLLAAEMSNAVAAAYVGRDRELRQNSTREAITWLSERVREQRDKLLAAEEQMRRLSPQTAPPPNDPNDLAVQEMSTLQQALLDVRLRILEVEARNIQREATPGESGSASSADEDIEAEVERELRDRIRRDLVDTTVALRQLRQRYGENHPDVLQMADKEKQLREDLERLGPAPIADTPSLLTGSQTRLVDLDTLRAQEQALSGNLADLIEENVADGNNDLQSTIVERELEIDRSLYNEMLDRLNEITISSGLDSPTAELFEMAAPPAFPVSPDHRQNILLGLFGGILIGLAGAMVRDHLDQSIRNPSQAHDLLKAPVLGVIPFQHRSRELAPGGGRPLLLYDNAESASSEAYRVLRSHIESRSTSGTAGVLLVTSALPGEGKTTTATNLAAAFAETGERVLLIDGDFRRGILGQLFGIRNGARLSRVLMGEERPDKAVHQTEVPGLDLLSSRPGSQLPNGPRLTKAFEDLLDWARGRYSHIVIDTPVAMLVPGVTEMARAGGSVLLVHRPGRVPTSVLEQVREHLVLSRTNLAGIVLNAVRANWVSEGYPLLPYYGTTYLTQGSPDGGDAEPQE